MWTIRPALPRIVCCVLPHRRGRGTLTRRPFLCGSSAAHGSRCHGAKCVCHVCGPTVKSRSGVALGSYSALPPRPSPPSTRGAPAPRPPPPTLRTGSCVGARCRGSGSCATCEAQDVAAIGTSDKRSAIGRLCCTTAAALGQAARVQSSRRPNLPRCSRTAAKACSLAACCPHYLRAGRFRYPSMPTRLSLQLLLLRPGTSFATVAHARSP